MKTSEIRRKFLDFFVQNEHQEVSSSSLVPGNDPTLLFTNAGMVPFKDVFLGDEQRNYTRATSSQRCVRAGGKHNDLENVGYTARHHTFFEMLGNFSFGDYFKREAIRFAWTFLTEELNLPKEKLWITVFLDDDEAADIWINEIGIDPARLSRLGEKDNFWSMGDTGPCGPCSEIFYDHGEHVPGGPPGSEGEDLDRYIEIWNIVFMQFNQDANGVRTPLPKPSVDTGMGVERIAAIMQGVHSNYEIDIFQHLIKAAATLCGSTDLENKSLRVIADHIRSCSFLITDGVVPSNEGRGYVLRRIIRRAVRHGNKLGVQGAFFNQLVSALGEVMGDAYPELIELKAHIEKVLLLEEEQFAKTLVNGMKILEGAIESLEGDIIDGETVFKLYDTYGFPLDLTADIARERDLNIDEAGFDVAMQKQKETAKAAGKFSAVSSQKLDIAGATEFTGYDGLSNQALVTGLAVDGELVEKLNEGQSGVIVLDQTAFYAESGGQAGDKGQIISKSSVFEVEDCIKQGELHLHFGQVVSGEFNASDRVNCNVYSSKRQATALHHSATHLLHAALRKVLGAHVQQKGSLVNEHRLRFDFSHLEAITPEELQKIEDMVNEQVLANTEISTQIMDIEAAKESGAMALFGEKYADDVRVLNMGVNDFSVELCGGIHAKRTGDIGLISIISESGIAAGVRRLEAVAGKAAMKKVQRSEADLSKIASIFKASNEEALNKVEQSQAKQKQLEKEIERLKSKLASSAGSDMASQAEKVGGVSILLAKVEGIDSKALRELVDQLKNKLGKSCVVVASVMAEDKIQICAGVSKDLIGQVKAGELVNQVATKVGGKGGGKPDLAMAGGSNVEALSNALEDAKSWLVQTLS
ncbi:alanine--tRNA ligase [Marinicellulosiphila megalodicopiae]|uniref:alanine--tRNA ligase n=1 Tax=Marinicellulosiphila megalodicopiae TaxID=2724896 RepID=UPI003BAF2DFC